MGKAIPTLALALALSLPLQAHGSKHDRTRIDKQLARMEQVFYQQPFDSVAQLARDIQRQSAAIGYTEGMAWAHFHMGTAYSDLELPDSALPHAHRSLQLFGQSPRQIVGHVRSLCLLADILLSNESIDSALIYNYKAIDLVMTGQHDTLLLAHPYHGLGQDYIFMGNPERARHYLTRAIALHRFAGNTSELANSMNSLGYLLAQQNDLLGSLEQHYGAMDLYTEINHIEGMLNQHNSIARILFMLNDYPQAIQHLKKALALKQQSYRSANISLMLMNIGTIYLTTNDLDSSLYYAQQAYKLACYHKMLNLQGHTALLLGEVLNLKAQYDTAASSLNIGLATFERIGNEEGIALALVLQAMGFIQQGQLPKAERLLNEAERMAKTIKMAHPKLDLRLLRARYELHIARNDHRAALQVHKSITAQQDSINRTINRIYAEHLEQNNMQAPQPQRTGSAPTPWAAIIIAIAAAALTATTAIVMAMRSNRKLLSKQTALLDHIDSCEQQQSKLVAQLNELTEQKELLMLQRDKILNLLSDLGDSISYAQKIQQAVLPQQKHLETIFSEHFVYYKPKDSVSGDFYWTGLTNNNHLVFVVGDSTGHGVPGAFMSILGISLIIEIVARNICDTPAQALDTMRDNIIYTLRQHDRDIDSNDGMDLAMCVYRPEEQKLYYCGANIPMYIATSQHLEPTERIRKCAAGLYEIKPDHMSICYSDHMAPFTDITLTLLPSDTIYLSTDGYPDQFGGEKNRKFGHPAFRALLNRIKSLPFDEQRQAIKHTIEDWKQGRTQTDDILVMGVTPHYQGVDQHE